jgi:hypothetical protein
MSVSPSFDLLASTTASTKRDPAAVSGIIGAKTTHLTGVSIFPLAPLDQQVSQLLGLTAVAGELWQTFTRETDIREGDVLAVGGTDYPVRAVGDWPWRPSGADRVVVVVEETKTT